MMRNFIILLLTVYCFSDHIKKNEMGQAYRIYKERCLQGFSWEREGEWSLGRPMNRLENNIKWIFSK